MQKYIQDFFMQEKGYFNSLVLSKLFAENLLLLIWLACVAARCVTKSPVYWGFCLSATQATFDTQQIDSLNIRLLKVYFTWNSTHLWTFFILEEKNVKLFATQVAHIFKWAFMSKVYVMFLQCIIGWVCLAVSRYKGDSPYYNQQNNIVYELK